MIKEMKIEKKQNYKSKEETIIASVDMVLLLTDMSIFKLLVRNESFRKTYKINYDRFEFISDYAMEPRICDRTIKNMIKWVRDPKYKNDYTDEKYDEMLRQFRRLYAEDIYKNCEPTQFSKSIPILYTQSTLKCLYVVLDSDEIVRKYQTKALVDLLGPYAYRMKLVIPDSPDDTIINIVKNDIKSVTSIYHDDVEIIKEAQDTGLDLTNLCFAISDLSYNYELLESPDKSEKIAMLKIDANKLADEQGTGIGMMEVKIFDDRDKYFALG